MAEGGEGRGAATTGLLDKELFILSKGVVGPTCQEGIQEQRVVLPPIMLEKVAVV